MEGIQKYKSEILPTISGESIFVTEIGLASFDKEEYDVNYNGQYYRITKK